MFQPGKNKTKTEQKLKMAELNLISSSKMGIQKPGAFQGNK